MHTVQQVGDFLAELAPPSLAAEWDNVGLLVGDPARPARRMMTCLTVTPRSVDEAVREQVDLIVTHHPLPFRPLKRLTTSDVTGRLLWKLAGAGIAVHSSHTAYDSAHLGINQSLAEGLGLTAVRPLIPSPELPGVGTGRAGQLPGPVPLAEMADRTKRFLNIRGLHQVGSSRQPIRLVAVACGSAGELLAAARTASCDLLVLGETSFHTCLEAEATGMALLLTGHFASERFGMERLAERLSSQFPEATIWPSRDESDPQCWVY